MHQGVRQRSLPVRPQPLKQQYPRAMTIAVGILARDGLVMASDTQVTSPGYMKLDQGKFAFAMKAVQDTAGSPPCNLIVSGAGAASSLGALRQEIVDSFYNASPVSRPSEIGLNAQKKLSDFHRDHITPHGRGELDVWLIIGAAHGRNIKLWSTDKTVIQAQSQFAAVGAGAMYAQSLLSRLFVPVSTRGALLLAIYVVWEVKKLIDGCGQYTDALGINTHTSQVFWPNRMTVRKLEDCFIRYSGLAEQSLHEMLGISWLGHLPNVSAEEKKIKRDIKKLMDSIEKLSPPKAEINPEEQEDP